MKRSREEKRKVVGRSGGGREKKTDKEKKEGEKKKRGERKKEKRERTKN